MDYTDVINYFSNFANDLVTLIYNPVMVIAMWMFYDESYWASGYAI